MQTAYLHEYPHPFTGEIVHYNHCAICNGLLRLNNKWPMMVMPAEDAPLIDCTGEQPHKIADKVQILKPVCWACAGVKEFKDEWEVTMAVSSNTLKPGEHKIAIGGRLRHIHILTPEGAK